MPNLLLALVLATGPEILLPPWPLSSDGDLVGVRGGAPLHAEHGTAERVAPGLYRVVPAPGALDVALAAGPARIAAQVEPPPGTIEVAVRPPAPVKGRDRRIQIEVAVTSPGGAPDPVADPPQVVASSGRVRDLERTGPGRFRGVYEPAPTRHPEVVVLLAMSPRCPLCGTPHAIGFAVVPLAAAIDLPGRADPGDRITIRVGERTFGPVTAGRTGAFSIPIEVPPGARFGSAVTLDPGGNRQAKEVDLHLPDVDTLACTAFPRALPADGRSAASVWCVASTPAGAAAADARLTLRASAGEAESPAPFRGALQRALFRAPLGGGAAEAILSAAYPDGGAASKDEIPILLAKGAPAEITAALATEPVAVGASVSARTEVRDARGAALGVPHGPAGARTGFVAPDRFVGSAEGQGFVQDAPLEFALSPGREAASLSLRREAAHWVAEARTVDGRPAAGVALRFGSGATAVTDERGVASGPAAGDREWVAAANGARAAGWVGIAPPAAPFEIRRIVHVALRPSSDVDVVAWLERGMLRWRVQDAQGNALAGRRVALRAHGVDLGPAEAEGSGGRAQIRGGRGAVAVIDLETGVAAVVEAR